MSEAIVPNAQKQRIIDYLKQGKRFDGRKPEDHREIEVKMNISNKAEGSCSVKFGNSEVYAGIKLSVVEPYPDSPNEGTLMTSAELRPMASPDFETGPPRINAIELARVIDRGIRESRFIDFEKLCIKKGEKVWSVAIDLYAINHDGNLMDVAGLAALIALGNAKMPTYDEKEGKIDYEKSSGDMPLNKEALSFNMTFFKVGNEIIVDPTKEEEDCADYRISIAAALTKEGVKISSIQKGGVIAITEKEMEKILNLVEVKTKEMFPKIEKFVWGK